MPTKGKVSGLNLGKAWWPDNIYLKLWRFADTENGLMSSISRKVRHAPQAATRGAALSNAKNLY